MVNGMAGMAGVGRFAGPLRNAQRDGAASDATGHRLGRQAAHRRSIRGASCLSRTCRTGLNVSHAGRLNEVLLDILAREKPGYL